MKNIGPAIKAMRKKAKMTQHELAAKCGVTRASICNIELGVQILNERTLYAIADALEYDVEIVFTKKS